MLFNLLYKTNVEPLVARGCLNRRYKIVFANNAKFGAEPPRSFADERAHAFGRHPWRHVELDASVSNPGPFALVDDRSGLRDRINQRAVD